MNPLIQWVLEQYGVYGFMAIVVAYLWWDGRKTLKENEKRYVDLLEKNALAHKASQDKFVDVAMTSIEALGEVKHAVVRLGDKIDERLPRGGR